MFQYSQRGTLVWLFIILMALALTMVAGAIPLPVGAALIAAWMALALFVTGRSQIASVLDSLPALGSRPAQPSEIAREAIARARRHPNYDALVQLIDVGLVVDEQRPDGLSLRRGRFISLDDEGIRPFAIFHVPDVLSERVGKIRFELRNETGEVQYVYETEQWLKSGENTILPNYRFPVRSNKNALDAGSWTAHILLDEGVLGIHNFSLSPSLASRRRQLAGTDGELRERVWQSDEDASLPISLEELLRQQSRQRQG
jgi:hypothetical protein